MKFDESKVFDGTREKIDEASEFITRNSDKPERYFFYSDHLSFLKKIVEQGHLEKLGYLSSVCYNNEDEGSYGLNLGHHPQDKVYKNFYKYIYPFEDDPYNR